MHRSETLQNNVAGSCWVLGLQCGLQDCKWTTEFAAVVHRREDMLHGILGEGPGKGKVRSPTFGFWCFVIALKFVQFVERAEAIKKESEVGSTHRATQKHPGRCTAVCSGWSQQAKAAIRIELAQHVSSNEAGPASAGQ